MPRIVFAPLGLPLSTLMMCARESLAPIRTPLHDRSNSWNGSPCSFGTPPAQLYLAGASRFTLSRDGAPIGVWAGRHFARTVGTLTRTRFCRAYCPSRTLGAAPDDLEGVLSLHSAAGSVSTLIAARAVLKNVRTLPSHVCTRAFELASHFQTPKRTSWPTGIRSSKETDQ
jgi:hypothetical protein